MAKAKISINPLMDFSTGTDSKKRRIIKDQKNPNAFRIGWYQTPRACIKKSIAHGGDYESIIDGVERLKSKILTKKNQIINKSISLEAMQRYMNINIPKVFKNHRFEIIKEKEIKSTWFKNVEVIVSPDLIYKIDYNGETYLGAVKLHISKNNIFDRDKLINMSAILQKYLIEISIKHDAKVLNELCFSYDVFGEMFVSAPENSIRSLDYVEELCDEINNLWTLAS